MRKFLDPLLLPKIGLIKPKTISGYCPFKVVAPLHWVWRGYKYLMFSGLQPFSCSSFPLLPLLVFTAIWPGFFNFTFSFTFIHLYVFHFQLAELSHFLHSSCNPPALYATYFPVSCKYIYFPMHSALFFIVLRCNKLSSLSRSFLLYQIH